MKFEKYNGLGNDFIITDENLSSEDIIKYCDRRFGIGADGVIILDKNNEMYNFKFFNSDGSIAKMCGNGIRCYAHYLYKNKLISNNKININTLSGIKEVEIFDENDFLVKVNMGSAINTSEKLKIFALDRYFEYIYTFTGTDHIVIFVEEENFNEDFVLKYAKEIQNNKEVFKNSININFVKINDENNISVITYERGAGLTLACGTGASAAVYISNILDYINKKVKVKLLGGELDIILENNEIIMIGKSEYVYSGIIK